MHYELIVTFSNFVPTFWDGVSVVKSLKMNVGTKPAKGKWVLGLQTDNTLLAKGGDKEEEGENGAAK
jgi:hypothetical protein